MIAEFTAHWPSWTLGFSAGFLIAAGVAWGLWKLRLRMAWVILDDYTKRMARTIADDHKPKEGDSDAGGS